MKRGATLPSRSSDGTLIAILRCSSVSRATGSGVPAARALGQPVILIEEETEDPSRGSGNVAYTWTLRVNLIFFNNIGQDPNPNVTPMTAINLMLDSFEQTFLKPDSQGGVLSLGGLVFECKMVGRIEKRQNATDGWAAAFVSLALESMTV